MQSKFRSYYKAEITSHFRAKDLRRDETSAEWLFRQMVRNRRIMGFKFKRQHPIGSYFADFYCHDVKLVVELDGDIHDIESVQKRDDIQEANIRGLGLHVMRFSNDDVFKNAHLVIGELEKYLAGHSSRDYPTSP